jgi:hypothetical protein
VLYKNNLVNSAMSELYHANGASNGYDQLGQLTAFARGTLSDTNSDGVPDRVGDANSAAVVACTTGGDQQSNQREAEHAPRSGDGAGEAGDEQRAEK